MTLNGANTYSGGTTIDAGKVRFGNSSALNTGTLSMRGGALTATANVTLTNGSSVAAGYIGTFAAAAGKTMSIGSSGWNFISGSAVRFGSASDTGTVLLNSDRGSGGTNPSYSIAVDGGTLKIGYRGNNIVGSANTLLFGSSTTSATLDLNGSKCLHLI